MSTEKRPPAAFTLFALLGSMVLFSGPAYGDSGGKNRITCESVTKVLSRVDDDVCAALSTAAEDCFVKLNYAYSHIKRSPGESREQRLQAIARLKADYENGLKTVNEIYLHMSKRGEGEACNDELGEVEVWIDELQQDLSDIKKPGF
ncbi:MAG: hypothetical protein HC902_02215 [Calothrix sp. SM1_5_4]|nr:hypothetical protein [Calothrix sp. SM1_5_4]